MFVNNNEIVINNNKTYHFQDIKLILYTFYSPAHSPNIQKC